MGFYYRKSVGLGPFRVNLSRSGVGVSVGAKGFRTGVTSKGRRYSTFGVPGTGIGYQTSHSRATGKGCLLFVVLALALAGSIWKGIS